MKSFAKSDSWYDYYTNISDKSFIKGNIAPDFTAITSAAAKGPPEKLEFEEDRRLFLLLATDTLTMPLTIAAALEDLKLLNKATIR